MHALHGAGVIHRDIKPQNIFMCETKGGELIAKLGDSHVLVHKAAVATLSRLQVGGLLPETDSAAFSKHIAGVVARLSHSDAHIRRAAMETHPREPDMKILRGTPSGKFWSMVMWAPDCA